MKKKLNYENVFYTPQFSNFATISVRRLSWYWNLPMTKTINTIIQNLPDLVVAEQVCQSCKLTDKCEYCAFNKPKLPPVEQASNLAAQ